MALFSQIRGAVAALALTGAFGAFGLTAAHATDGGWHGWQPCPSSLGVKDGEQPAKKWEVTLSPYAYHWNYNPEHKHVMLGAIDSHLSGGRFCGLAFFSNSFGQSSAYAYAGQRWDNVFGNPNLFAKVSAGLIYGYRGLYQDKIPLNHYGIAPAVIPSLGYTFSPEDSAQVFILGNAGLLFAYTRGF
jgi:hypothetical protein